jgi:hypothetical protein
MALIFRIFTPESLPTLGLKYKLVVSIFWAARHHLISDALAERTHQFLTHLRRRRAVKLCAYGEDGD